MFCVHQGLEGMPVPEGVWEVWDPRRQEVWELQGAEAGMNCPSGGKHRDFPALGLELLDLAPGWGRGSSVSRSLWGLFSQLRGVTGAENEAWGGTGLSEVLKWDRVGTRGPGKGSQLAGTIP